MEAKPSNPPTKYKTRMFVTKFEEAAIIGMRMEQLARSAPTFLENCKLKDIRQISAQEYNEGKLPIYVGRKLLDGTEERIPLNALRKKNDL
jgi:DNA-directed RNA polymerase subunit K/omega